jgi:glycine oxidase
MAPPRPTSPSARKVTSLPKSPDLVVVGGGIVGLWIVEQAARRGLNTVLVEKNRVGQGASGGFLGALMPHQPVRWNPEKAFQLSALLSLEPEITRLEELSGISCGYKRCGRLIPTHMAKKRDERPVWQAAAKANWPQISPSGAPIGWSILEAPEKPGWLATQAAPLGCEFETLSARLAPRALVAALTKQVCKSAHVSEEAHVTWLGDGHRIVLADGTEITPGKTIVTAGYETFSLLGPLTGLTLGRGVKGQAALLKPRHPVDPRQPIIYLGGLYIIAHDDGLVAVGSTSETTFADPSTTTGKLDALVDRAREICPALEGAEVVERWAGVRPNAIGRHPLIGPLPEAPDIIVATGGFKISYGIAHKMADAALDFATGTRPALPDTFEVRYHLACAEAKRRSSPTSN